MIGIIIEGIGSRGSWPIGQLPREPSLKKTMPNRLDYLYRLKPNSGVFKLLKNFGDKGAAATWIKAEKPSFLKIDQYYDTLYKLKKGKFILVDGQFVKFIENGIIEYIRTKMEETNPLPNCVACIAVFDVPEKQRKIRKLLNKLFTALSFLPIQKSVWISLFDNAKLLKELLRVLKIEKWVRVFTGKEE